MHSCSKIKPNGFTSVCQETRTAEELRVLIGPLYCQLVFEQCSGFKAEPQDSVTKAGEGCITCGVHSKVQFRLWLSNAHGVSSSVLLLGDPTQSWRTQQWVFSLICFGENCSCGFCKRNYVTDGNNTSPSPLRKLSS